MRKKISTIIKFSIGFFSLFGIILACIFATKHGYSHWYKRLYYFTQQSNLWIGISSIVLGILTIVQERTGKKLVKNYMYTFKYTFTVSITLTGIIFCGLLAPFARDIFDVWSFSSVVTHIIVPILSIVDFIIDDYYITFKKSTILWGLLPPFAYLIIASIPCLLKVDFGLGLFYPYFFMDYYSPAGFFGFVQGTPPVLGTAYWLILITLFVLLLSYIFYAIHPQTRKYNKQSKSKKN